MSPDSSNGPTTDTATDAAFRTRSRHDGGGAGITAAAVIVALLVGIIGIFDVAAGTAPQIGQPAPDFTALDSQGNSVQLHAYRGKTVVLEWTNADCPYTRKHYTSGNMQSMQGLAQRNGVVWLTVISSAPGKQGYVNGPAANALTQSRKAVPAAVLLDPQGEVARMYAAKTTPHLFVIDKNGTLQYMGGMDSLATVDEADIARAEPYLKEAMLAVVQGNPVPHPVTTPYGCSIKY
ncbi:MAG TPA: redoxin domain-containing protein [Steroidobacteraceae bacterium]|nr:redoxin domain-containing protein [Steroidobacteraceae bacterium]